MTTAPATSDFLKRYQLSPLELRLAWRQRMKAGLLYGLLLSSVYALAAGTIDVATFPDLPLRVDWRSLGQDALFTVLGSLVLSALTAWPANPTKGILAGAAAIVFSELLRSFLWVGSAGLILLLLTLPLLVMSFPIAAVFRWAVQQHTHLAARQLKWRAGLVVVIVALGIFAGSWSRMPPDAEASVRQVHAMLRRTRADTGGNLPLPLRSIPDFRARAGQAYQLSQRASAASPTAVDVQVVFDNGYVITCFVETTTPSALCAEGTQSPFGPSRYNARDQR